MMTRATLEQLERQGVSFRLVDGQVKINAPAHILTPELQAKLSRHKPLLCEWLKPQPSGDWHDRYKERSGILENEGQLLRHEAEYRARREVLHDYVAVYYPMVMGVFDVAVAGRVN
jgi:hypothetical protein